MDTPTYKVGFYASPCYHIQDADGKRYGYGYEMMQSIVKHIQATLEFVDYDVSFSDSFELLRQGQIDILTGVKHTDDRDAEFAFSVHPVITATTCMNVKAGNTTVVAGDYSTYNGLCVGLLARHTYNYKFLQFAEEKGFDCTIVYYDTPTELTAEERALLETMRQEHVVVRALMNPDEKPYSWFEGGEAKGIVPDIFRRTIEILGLDYEIVETSSRAHYEQVRAAIVPGATLELRMGVSDQETTASTAFGKRRWRLSPHRSAHRWCRAIPRARSSRTSRRICSITRKFCSCSCSARC